MSIAEGRLQQQATLNHINDFAHRHKLKWDAEKCSAMEIRCHRDVQISWKLGTEEVKHSQSYKYPGEIIDRNGKNQENLQEKLTKAKQSTISIVTCGPTGYHEKSGGTDNSKSA